MLELGYINSILNGLIIAIGFTAIILDLISFTRERRRIWRRYTIIETGAIIYLVGVYILIGADGVPLGDPSIALVRTGVLLLLTIQVSRTIASWNNGRPR